MKTSKNKCEYDFPNCQRTAIIKHFVQFGGVKLTKGYWTCQNCQAIITKYLNERINMNQKEIKIKLKKLNRLIESFQEAQVIEPDDPETWDADALYNLTEELKEALEILEDQKKKDGLGNPIVLEGLCSLIESYQSEEEEEEE